MRKHHELIAWQESMALVKEIYKVTQGFPKEETYGLVSQMRRAAVSVPSNISEGAARGSQKEFVQFLIIARGSLSELETQLLLSRDLGFMKEDQQLMQKVEKIFALIGGLLKNLRERGLKT